MPIIGDKQRGRQIGLHCGSWFIYVKCSKCGKERWTYLNNYNKPTYTGLCHKCHINQFHGVQFNATNWKGGRYLNKRNGYYYVRLQKDDFFFSMALANNYVLEHRLIMAKHLGRCLHSWEIVHHKDHNRINNDINNLQLVDISYHQILTVLENSNKKLQLENNNLKYIISKYPNDDGGQYIDLYIDSLGNENNRN
jgi:ribosomal protein S27E